MREFTQETVSHVFGSLAVAAGVAAWGYPDVSAEINEQGLDCLFPNLDNGKPTKKNIKAVVEMRRDFAVILEENGFDNFYTKFDDDWFLDPETELADITTVFVEYVVSNLENKTFAILAD